jgi:hypothetical protein
MNMNSEEKLEGEVLSPRQEGELKFSQTPPNDAAEGGGSQEPLYCDLQSRSFWVQEGDEYSTIYHKHRKSDLSNICLTRDSALGGPPRPWELKERRHNLESVFARATCINCVGPKGVLTAELREKNGHKLLVRPFPGFAEGPGVAAWRQCFEDYGLPHDAYGRWEALARIVIKYGLHIHVPQIVHELVIFNWFNQAHQIGDFTQAQYNCRVYGNRYQIKGWVRELERESLKSGQRPTVE